MPALAKMLVPFGIIYATGQFFKMWLRSLAFSLLFIKNISPFQIVKTARKIYHNQLLTKYWTNDVKSATRWKLMNRWRQNDVKSAARYRLLNRWPRKPGDKVVSFWWAEKLREKWRYSLKNGEVFWMNNKAIIEFGFRRIWRILQISEGVIHRGRRPRWITPSLICRILHILRKPNSIIANYKPF